MFLKFGNYELKKSLGIKDLKLLNCITKTAKVCTEYTEIFQLNKTLRLYKEKKQ